MARTDQNESVIEKDLSDDNYMYVDELQKLTDEYVTDFNSSLIPKPIWRPFIESLFENYVTLDLDKKDKILVSNLDYLKDTALILASYEEEELGMCASYSLSVLIKNIIFVNSFSQINIYNFDSETYIWWVVVDMVVPQSSKKLRDIWETYVYKMLQVEVREPRSLECASNVNEIMGNCTIIQ